MFSANTTQVSTAANYIEDVFSTYLYTGNGSTQTITNGIDLSGKGGLVWAKDRDAANSNTLYDTARGVSKTLYSNTTGAQVTEATNEGVYSFGATGFSIGGASGQSNGSGNKEVSWTFRKQPKFFDVVTYTGTGTGSPQNIPHNLGSAPGCMIVKRTDSTSGWYVYHQSIGNTNALYLNGTAASTADSAWNNTSPTSTQFTVNGTGVNQTGATYVAYLFAHNAGGFGLTGTDNVISCGSYTGNGSATGPVINLGFEPQWVLIKNASAGWNWKIVDVMRGMALTNTVDLEPNTSGAENAPGVTIYPTATGFTVGTSSSTWNGNGNTIIYIAIRRGPMKTPTSGTSVYNAITRAGTGAAATISGVGFTPDTIWPKMRDGIAATSIVDRLRGISKSLRTTSTSAESTSTAGFDVTSFNMDGVSIGNSDQVNLNDGGQTYVNWFLKRAPGFFDEVCYSGTNAATTITHNLGVAPELMIVKNRTLAANWVVYSAALGNDKILRLNLNNASASTTDWNTTSPTSSVFSVSGAATVNGSGYNYVAYLFASCPGVSKVGSYTGNGSTQTINCGFTGGARFVLIKRTDAAGDWYVYDTARGMTTLTDPYLLLNSTAAESATLGSVTTVTTGFAVNASILAAINTNGASYIFLAIA